MYVSLEKYIELLTAFVTKKNDAIYFENKFLTLFKNDNTAWSKTEFKILDGLFADVDAFCADPQLRDEGDLNEIELREKCKIALEKLQTFELAHS